MLAKVSSCAVVGLDGEIVEVEVDISQGLPAFAIVGLPDAAVQEAKERVRSAIRNSGHDFPLKRITVNLPKSHGWTLPNGRVRAEGQHRSVTNTHTNAHTGPKSGQPDTTQVMSGLRVAPPGIVAQQSAVEWWRGGGAPPGLS